MNLLVYRPQKHSFPRIMAVSRIQPNGPRGMAGHRPSTPPSGLTALGRRLGLVFSHTAQIIGLYPIYLSFLNPGFSFGIIPVCPNLNSSGRFPVCHDSLSRIAIVPAVLFAASLRSVELISSGPVASADSPLHYDLQH